MNKNFFENLKDCNIDRAFRLYDEGMDECNKQRSIELLTEAAKLLGFNNIIDMIKFLHNDLDDIFLEDDVL